MKGATVRNRNISLPVTYLVEINAFGSCYMYFQKKIIHKNALITSIFMRTPQYKHKLKHFGERVVFSTQNCPSTLSLDFP